MVPRGCGAWAALHAPPPLAVAREAYVCVRARTHTHTHVPVCERAHARARTARVRRMGGPATRSCIDRHTTLCCAAHTPKPRTVAFAMTHLTEAARANNACTARPQHPCCAGKRGVSNTIAPCMNDQKLCAKGGPHTPSPRCQSFRAITIMFTGVKGQRPHRPQARRTRRQ